MGVEASEHQRRSRARSDFHQHRFEPEQHDRDGRGKNGFAKAPAGGCREQHEHVEEKERTIWALRHGGEQGRPHEVAGMRQRLKAEAGRIGAQHAHPDGQPAYQITRKQHIGNPRVSGRLSRIDGKK